MLGIIMKDFYESFCLRKSLIEMMISFICYLVAVCICHNLYGLLLLVIVLVPMMGCSTLQYSMEQDSISKYNKRLLSLPLTRKEIVASKIISTIILSILVNVFLSLPTTLVYSLLYHVADLSTSIWIWVAGFIITFIMTPINNVGFFLFGNKKGMIVYVLFLVFITVLYVVTSFSIGLENISSISTGSWFLIGIILAIVLNVISYFSCIKIYTMQYS